MKKSTKIILPALAVLVLSTAAAATGTVAWFASNNVVTATGMSVQCATSRNLLIANNSSGTDGDITAASTSASTKSLKPSSAAVPASDKDFEFFYVNDAGIVANTGRIKSGATVTKATGSENPAVFAKYSFWVQAQGEEMTKFSIDSVAITKTGTTSEITKAMRFGVTYKTYHQIAALGAGADESYKALTKAGEVTEAAADGSSVTIGGEEATATVSPVTEITSTSPINLADGKVAVDTWTEIDFYFWYEGQDSNCTTKNAKNVETLTFVITMSAN